MTIKKAIEVLKTYNHDDDKEGEQAFKVAIKSLESKLRLDLIEFYPYNLAIEIYGGKEHRNHEGYDGESVEEKAIKLSVQGMHKEILKLEEREEIVLMCRFKKNLTLKQTGERLGVTPERVRQIEVKAIRKLRHPSRIAKMKSYTYEDVTRDRDKLNELQEKNKLLEKAIRLHTRKEIDKEQLEVIAGKADLHDVLIEELDLSVRSYNCVKRKGIESIGELAEMDYEELIKIRGMGRKTTEEIIRNLKEFDVYLKGTKSE